VQAGHAGKQVVRVTRDVGPGESAMKIRSQARKEAFARAVLQEAAEILPSGLSRERMDLLLERLRPQTQSFVLSYTEEDVVQKNETLILLLSVQINNWVLKDFLKAWGTYYTAGSEWQYALRAESLSGSDRKELQELEKLTGVQQKGSGFPVLELRRQGRESKFIRGILETEERRWQVTDTEMGKVWKELWSRYFSQPEIRSRVVKRLVLQVKGWDTTSGVQAFDTRLAQWESMAERPTLLDMQMLPGRIEGSWLVATINEEELRRRLQEYGDPRGLTFMLDERGRP
jgi:hypothetical protein